MSAKGSRALRTTAALCLGAGVLVASQTGPVTSPAVAGSGSYSLSRQTYPDGRSVVARWNPCQKAITYRVNTKYAASTAAGRASALRDVKGAVARVSAATGIRFRYVGSTARIPKDTASATWAARETGAEIYVAWVKQSSASGRTNLLGTTGNGEAAGSGGYAYKIWKVGSDPWRGVTGRGFVVLDSSQNPEFKPGFGSGTTRGDLLLHEFGHVMGMNHVASTKQVMYPSIVHHSSSRYGTGDKLGLERLGRSAGCVAVPAWVWRDLS